ncbi:TsoY family (seleno)protein [Alkalilimnicola ehrlichii MLHE-1]|uniref:Uncharacterized protein n=1 Tax=Alkalilimnicola ehrlichii (strain ATCC BAA-1101 / DSM 17681 / MLHE-1) TaxID=187272 RepID=Q0AAN0_ALKEH|nr:hypothetical protein [Alkalilimnicola ehrlichii]ABI56107.1 conserved hypothetical protein [Alkalilimnicola ehrlichii MLHE-1]
MLQRLPHTPPEQYSPLYFLAALGAGGLGVAFFMWLMHWMPYSETPMPVFDELIGVLGQGPLYQQLALIGAWLGIAYFSVLHFRLLAWNLKSFQAFRRTAAYRALRESNAETQLLAGPLTLAMSINVGFVLGMAFVPGLWQIVEWLFPMALLAFLAVGVWALMLLRDFWGRVLTEGNFDCTKNNSFAQLLPAFALSMIGVGLAAPAAMSENSLTVLVSLVLSSFFIVTAIISGTVQLILGIRGMLDQGANPETAPSLWIVVPILTVLSIALLRQGHGIEVLGDGVGGVQGFGLLTTLLMAQVAFGLLGWVVLRRYGYFRRFVTGSERSPGSYTLVCPGVAITVMLHFWVNVALADSGAIAAYGGLYWTITGVALAFHAATIWLVMQLNRKHFGNAASRPSPARA